MSAAVMAAQSDVTKTVGRTGRPGRNCRGFSGVDDLAT